MGSEVEARYARLAAVLGVAVSISLLVWARVPWYVVGWDVNVYRSALNSLRAGHDPYRDAMAAQPAFYAHLAEHRQDPLPFAYIDSPITLPVLRPIAAVPYRVVLAGGARR